MNQRYLLILMLLISFGSIGAVAFTPGLPSLANYFAVSSQQAEACVTWYLLGYAIGQLIYGPLTNRLGSRLAIIMGAAGEIIGALGCILAAHLHSFEVLLIARFIMAVGAGSGLTLSFTISSKLCRNSAENAQSITLLTLAFAITPGLGVFIGGLLVDHYGWISTFYFMAGYGLFLLVIGAQLPEVIQERNFQALNLKQLAQAYRQQIQQQVISGGLLVGAGTCIVYTFAAMAPFIAMQLQGMSPVDYGRYNFIPVAGMLIGPFAARYLSRTQTPRQLVKLGLIISSIGILLLGICLNFASLNPLSLFGPMLIIYFGFTFVFGNGSALGLKYATDKSNASAMMSFINMFSAVIVVAIVGHLAISSALIMPAIFIGYIILGSLAYISLS